jgi:hypothetical protein
MNNSRIVVGLGVVILMVLFAVALFSLGAGSRPDDSNQKKAAIKLTDHTDDGSLVRLTIEGPVTADELHRTTIITVGGDSRALDIYKTYGNQSALTQSFTNNQTAFTDLMYALNDAGFARASQANGERDETGVCPTGQRYIYELIHNDQVTMRLWGSSCKDKRATFGGNSALVQTLFQKQIPKYSSLANSVQ